MQPVTNNLELIHMQPVTNNLELIHMQPVTGSSHVGSESTNDDVAANERLHGQRQSYPSETIPISSKGNPQIRSIT